MDGFTLQVLDKVPLAQATFQVLSHALDDTFLEEIYEKHRGASYTKLIRFPVITRVICDALLRDKSGRRVFEKAREEEILTASVEAAYKKLGRLPVAVSTAFLEGASGRIRELFPQGCEETSLPASLAHFTGIVIDGKATKQIPHRLKPLRSAEVGGLVGGRGLVATHLQSGLVLAMEADEDGDANETPWVPQLMEKVRASTPGPRLIIADRQFSYPCSLVEFSRGEDAFVVRWSKAIPFFRDESRPTREGKDADGRDYVEEWGWLGVERHPQRYYVRRITVKRPGADAIIVVTNLLDADGYPAADLLEAYRRRTSIEYVFERITEVFALRRLIGTRPRATLFQLSLCLVLYNVLQLVRAYIAHNNDKPLDRVSPKKLLEDIREQMTSCLVIVEVDALTACIENLKTTVDDMKRFLTEKLRVWENRWTKAKSHRNRPETPKRQRCHDSTYRVLQRAKTNK
jgi:DDE family transposase